MEKFIIEKSQSLKGTVKVGGSKNSVLPILAASLLTEEECIIRDVPGLSDVCTMENLIKFFGANIEWNREEGIIRLQCSKVKNNEAPYELARQMRASFLIMGPIISRMGKVKLPLPGGCAIGSRPVDLHLKGIMALGAKISNEHGYVYASAKKLKGNNVYLDFPSVGATENIMMAAVLAQGQTIIENCAVEPEIVDLSNFLNGMGAKVKGAGTDTIRINGVSKLKGIDHTIIPDRIEAGTFMIAAAITKGDVIIENLLGDHVKPIIAKLKETGISIEEKESGLRVFDTNKKIIAADIKTMPYPGFPTDMQAQFMSLLTQCDGTSVVTETVFENRFMHVGELKRMGADIKIESRSAVVEGVEKLMGAQVKATDLRAGAALILSALGAEGTTEVSDIFHVDRGYCSIEKKLQNIGAKIKRVNN